MGRKTVLLDDLDGTELPDDTQPVSLSLGRTTYSLYLTEANHGKLMDALTPFIENAETSTSTPTPRPGSVASARDKDKKERDRKARAWAIETGYEYEDAQGNKKTLGDRGRIPDVVVKAWVDAGEPEVGNE